MREAVAAPTPAPAAVAPLTRGRRLPEKTSVSSLTR